LQVEAEDEGMLILDVQPGSLAARAGLEENDRIVSVGGRTFRDAGQLRAWLSGREGDRVPFVVLRDGEEQTIEVMIEQQEGDQAWLGVFLEESEEGAEGTRVAHVFPAGPAARAGFRPGDVVIAVNGQEATNVADFISTVESLEPGGQAEFLVRRNDREMALTATLGNKSDFVFSNRPMQGGQEYEGQDSQRDDAFANLPPYAMELEHHRRMAEQHQRLEGMIEELTEEVRQLREEFRTSRR
jgi:S1-C subfamily serine protease